MRKFVFHLGVTLRSYGNVEVEAESVEAALPILTADYVGDNITIVETTTDSGQDLAIINISDADTDEDFKGYDGHSLPSPYDPKPDAKLIATLRDCIGALSACVDQIHQMQGMFDDGDGAIQEALDAAEDAEQKAREAIASAEGRANG